MSPFEKLREEYKRSRFSEDEAGTDPHSLFARWFERAAKEVPMANAMALSTVDEQGSPHCRMVLLKEANEHGLSFYTNYESDKGRHLEHNARASLLFWWQPLEQQIRVDGSCYKLPGEDSDEYFSARPRESNLGAIASKQSRVLEDRTTLEAAVARLEQGTDPLLRPGYWGGYRLVPDRFEFWQGRENRLHDRFRFERAAAGEDWERVRLYP